MKLLDDDWSGPTVVTVATEYPDGPIADFVNWVRRSKAWHADIETMRLKVQRLNDLLGELRVKGVDQAEKNRQRTAKARETRAANRVKAGV